MIPAWVLLAACGLPGPEVVDWDRDGHLEPADCDDDDPLRAPGAAEGCDRIDHDCDGVVTCVAGSGTMATLDGAPGDHAGESVAGLGDLDGDGFHDLMIGATGRNERRGVVWLLYGPVAPGAKVELAARADAEFLGELADDGAGAHAGRTGDVNGDGYPDLLVAYRRKAQNFPGGLGLWFGGPERFSGAHPLARAPVRFEGEIDRGTGEQLGVSREVVGSALLLGAMYHSEDGAHQTSGAVYLIPFDAVPSAGLVEDAGGLAATTVLGSTAGDLLGSAVAAPDLDGDGVPDLALGAQGVASFQGAVYVLSGRSLPAGAVPADAADLTWSGEGPGAYLGTNGGLTSLVDVNGDGHDDLFAVGAHREAHAGGSGPADGGGYVGAGYLVRGAPDLSSGPAAEAASTEVRGTPGAGVAFGASGDFDRDGIVDLAVSGPGGIWVFDAPVPSGVLGKADASWVIVGATPADALAAGGLEAAIAAAGDVDGDGTGDIVLGANNARGDAGAAYLLFGDRR